MPTQGTFKEPPKIHFEGKKQRISIFQANELGKFGHTDKKEPLLPDLEQIQSLNYSPFKGKTR